MSLFGSLMGDVEDDPFFGSHMRHMRQMNNMMNSMFSDPFGMLGGGGPLALTGPRHGNALMPFMPQMPSLTRLFSGNIEGNMGAGSSFTSSTVIMSSGPNGKPQVYSTTSSTKIGPNGLKETKKTLQDSRTGTKKMSIGHHIGSRAHLIEREQNVYSGDAEERQEFINLDEDEAEDFDREFQAKAGMSRECRESRALLPARPALPAPPLPREEARRSAPAPRRPLRAAGARLPSAASTSVREVYGGSHPQRHRHKHHKSHRHNTAE
ncbi:myeloid leukemia factor isoform X2 [Plodia interpunctella]|uniref:myeloid leukemia factor isoform X2 n=1 Tax=Plodia interpunctella TaxID=58824 RepID=UPI002368765B|nr:myeloid leukemia factor isoform X2 [Plodia interpunctella]